MGYETRLIIGPEYVRIPDLDPVPMVQRVAEVDLSKAGYVTHTGTLLAECRQGDERFGFYADDGDTRVTKDRYGDQLTAVPLADLVDAMERDQVEQGEYRRFTLALAVLRLFRDDPAWQREASPVRVVQFGY